MPYKDRETRLAYHRAKYAAHRESALEEKRAYYQANKEALKAQHKAHHERNREAMLATMRAYYAAHGEAVREARRAYRAKYRKALLAKARVYRAAHAEEARAKARAWRAAHREQHLARALAYQKAHPEQHAESQARRRARKAAAPVNNLSAAQWREIQAAQDHQCAHCHRRCQGGLTQDHIVALSNGGSHTLHNVIGVCRSCNSKKGTNPSPVLVQPLLLTVAPATKP